MTEFRSEEVVVIEGMALWGGSAYHITRRHPSPSRLKRPREEVPIASTIDVDEETIPMRTPPPFDQAAPIEITDDGEDDEDDVVILPSPRGMPTVPMMWTEFRRRFGTLAWGSLRVKTVRQFMARRFKIDRRELKRSPEWTLFLDLLLKELPSMPAEVIEVSSDKSDLEDEAPPPRRRPPPPTEEPRLNVGEHINALTMEGLQKASVKPRDPHESFLGKLLPFQRHALGWMLFRERHGDARGGILADDMGLGKTVQILALLSHPLPQPVEGFGGNLIVCRTTLLEHWNSHVEKLLPTLTRGMYYGPSRHQADALRKDIVITTYGVLSRDHTKNGPLHGRFWARVILDEAHEIKNPGARITISCVALHSISRWCVTGTPLQNKVAELQSLFRFLHIAPYHNPRQFSKIFPYTPHMDPDAQARTFQRLRWLMMAFSMRRTKDDMYEGKPLLELPPLTYHVHELDLTPEERGIYVAIRHSGLERLGELHESNTRGRFMETLTILLRLRQLCAHRALLPKDLSNLAIDASAALFSTPCVVCHTLTEDTVVTACNHVLCLSCAERILEEESPIFCPGPACPHEFQIKARASELNAAGDLDDLTPSSKIIAVLDIVNKYAVAEKIVVFSLWPGLLQLLQKHLEERGVQTGLWIGSMPCTQRLVSLRNFQQNPEVRVMLLSTMAGGTGLNIVEASVCVLCDPWWNPSIDKQAMMRVHRIGQTRPVTVIQLATRNTVEEQILTIVQKKKAEVIEGTLGYDGEIRSFTAEDFQALLVT